MIQIPFNEKMTSDYEAVVNDVLNQLASGKDKYGEGALGTAYIDWGAISEFYQNCPTRFIAYKVAYEFKAKGYYVYVQRMGGHSRIPEGTPICYRIYKQARLYNNWEVL